MARYEWQLIKTFTLPLDSKGRQLWRVDFDANYHSDLAKLRKEYQDYSQELRGDIHEVKEFWVLLPTDNPTVLYETTDYKMDELAGDYSTPENNQIKPINFKQLQDKERFKGDLDYLHGQIEEMLRDEWLEAYPELNCALQDVSELIEKLDIKIDYYNC
ncbi:MAG: hypothetical protein I4E98_15235 [Planktothrix agardhii KL2]|jgi:hypothetical protein|uniref:hypothetical protein n=1 Tax=Planktothrix agardhii TaxID=1160 RepID=UPI001A3175AC|nr:hypothetical protein [Planktothrix agardhii]MBG0747920.1 hypothetical protein [Planktothrix agardhii KL2]